MVTSLYSAWNTKPRTDCTAGLAPGVNYYTPVRDTGGFSYGSPTPGNTSHADTIAWGQIRPKPSQNLITQFKAGAYPTIQSWFDCYFPEGILSTAPQGSVWAGSNIQIGKLQTQVSGVYVNPEGGDDTNGWWPLNTYGTSAYVAATLITNINSVDNQARWLWENVFRWHCCADPSKQVFKPDITYQNPLSTLMISNENDNRSQGPTSFASKSRPCYSSNCSLNKVVDCQVNGSGAGESQRNVTCKWTLLSKYICSPI